MASDSEHSSKSQQAVQRGRKFEPYQGSQIQRFPWDRLPMELRCLIIEHFLWFEPPLYSWIPMHLVNWLQTLIDLENRDIASAALQIFYERKTWRIFTDRDFPGHTKTSGTGSVQIADRRRLRKIEIYTKIEFDQQRFNTFSSHKGLSKAIILEKRGSDMKANRIRSWQDGLDLKYLKLNITPKYEDGARVDLSEIEKMAKETKEVVMLNAKVRMKTETLDILVDLLTCRLGSQEEARRAADTIASCYTCLMPHKVCRVQFEQRIF